MKKIISVIGGTVLGVLLLMPIVSLAQTEAVKLSITPPLIKNNVSPGQIWKSQVKLVNNNPTPLKAYVRVQDFRGRSDNGTVEFIDKNPNPEESKDMLSSWIELLDDAIEIPPYESRDIPFVIIVPEDASPGGHYAAILAGTSPPEPAAGGSSIAVSSLLASLLLVTVKGDVIEEGSIREFSTDKSFYSRPHVDFTVGFDNQGNTHIQPRGEIKIMNLFNKERGLITINHGTETGNVLPGETRRWEFSWEGESNLLDMGRYRADLILGFGEENGQQTVNQTLYFWVIYWQPVLIFLGVIIFIVLLTIFFIKRSVRKAVEKTQQSMGLIKPVKRPVSKEEEVESLHVGWSTFKIFITAVIVFVVLLIGGISFVYLFNQNPDEAVKKLGDAQVSTDIEAHEKIETEPQVQEVKKDESPSAEASEDREEVNKDVSIKILNGSGTSGVAGEMEDLIKNLGFTNTATGNADNYDYESTLIYYQDPANKNVAQLLADEISGSTVIRMNEEIDSDMEVIVGSQFK